jgi:pantetheine-phosphate adenylyltransferase
MNRRLNEEIESVFIMTDERFQFVSSTFTKEIARLGGDISTFVSPAIALKLKEKFGV